MEPTTTDERLILECVQGGEAAWRAFLDLYSGIIHKTIYKTMTSLGVWTSYQSHNEDIYMEALRSLYVNLRKFKGDCSPKTWIIVCVRNLTINEIKKISRATRPEQGSAEVDDSIEDRETPRFDKTVETRQLIERMESRLREAVDDKGWLFYQLIFRGDLSNKEIAATLGVTEEVARVRKKRLRDRVQEILAELTSGREERAGP